MIYFNHENWGNIKWQRMSNWLLLCNNSSRVETIFFPTLIMSKRINVQTNRWQFNTTFHRSPSLIVNRGPQTEKSVAHRYTMRVSCSSCRKFLTACRSPLHEECRPRQILSAIPVTPSTTNAFVWFPRLYSTVGCFDSLKLTQLKSKPTKNYRHN